MKQFYIPSFILLALIFLVSLLFLKEDVNEKNILHSEIEKQVIPKACWVYTTITFIETDLLTNRNLNINLSEKFIIYASYLERFKEYLSSNGSTKIVLGGLPDDVFNIIENYGVVPEKDFVEVSNEYLLREIEEVIQIFSFKALQDIKRTENDFNKTELIKIYISNFQNILKFYIGSPPKTFFYNSEEYTPKNFAKNILKLNKNNFIGITSIPSEEYNQFIYLPSKDNWNNSFMYYNVFNRNLINISQYCIEQGKPVIFGIDISELGNDFINGNLNLTKYSFPGIDTMLTRENEIGLGLTTDDHSVILVGVINNNLNDELLFKFVNSSSSFFGIKYLLANSVYLENKTFYIFLEKDIVNKFNSTRNLKIR